MALIIPSNVFILIGNPDPLVRLYASLDLGIFTYCICLLYAYAKEVRKLKAKGVDICTVLDKA